MSGDSGKMDVISDNQIISLTGKWLFRQGDDASYSEKQISNAGWIEKSIGDGLSLPGVSESFVGVAWYRLKLFIKETGDYSILIPLSYGPVQVFFNGYCIGGDLSFDTSNHVGLPGVVAIPSHLQKQG